MTNTEEGFFYFHACEACQPDTPYTVSQWADKNRYLNTVASAEPGLWRTKRTPYLREIMDNLSSCKSVETTVVMKATQIGITEAALNFCGYIIHHSSGPALYVMPTVGEAQTVSKNRFNHMIEASPALNKRMASARSRGGWNTILSKEFDDGILMFTGARSAVSLRAAPIRYLILDEVDAYPLNVQKRGDPVSLAETCTSTFTQRKIFKFSKPRHRNTSRIAKDFALGDQRYYNVPCDGCGTLQPIVWSQIQWPEGAPEKAVFVCAHCGHKHAEHRKEDLLSEERGARWIPTQKSSEPGLRSYHISALYSPWMTWEECAREFSEAKDDPDCLQVFVNGVLGEPWENKLEQSH
ncbi:phage terminase large subunit GpA-like protein [Bartonella chomelii]|uniref:Phage terminase large subunit GpA-like protein n=1 Tax=Bartonella chomelii TaxID=236402 RepID=A0ABR6E4P0_9HYPH|nr:phage terminase large subunit GpA-like protein [Bartonella chomelii]